MRRIVALLLVTWLRIFSTRDSELWSSDWRGCTLMSNVHDTESFLLLSPLRMQPLAELSPLPALSHPLPGRCAGAHH